MMLFDEKERPLVRFSHLCCSVCVFLSIALVLAFLTDYVLIAGGNVGYVMMLVDSSFGSSGCFPSSFSY